MIESNTIPGTEYDEDLLFEGYLSRARIIRILETRNRNYRKELETTTSESRRIELLHNIAMCDVFWMDLFDIRPDNVEQVKNAVWVKISPAGIYECSNCKKNVMTSDIEAYERCHGCGAHMRLEEE